MHVLKTFFEAVAITCVNRGGIRAMAYFEDLAKILDQVPVEEVCDVAEVAEQMATLFGDTYAAFEVLERCLEEVMTAKLHVDPQYYGLLRAVTSSITTLAQQIASDSKSESHLVVVN